MATTALQTLVVVIVIGVITGLVANRWGRRWFGTRTRDMTVTLIGIAGAFIGFHVGTVFGFTPAPAIEYLAAIAGAFVILWWWRNR